MTAERTLRRAMVAVFLVALVCRLAYVHQLARTPFSVALVGDEEAYSERAQALLRDGFMGGDRPYYQDPLYPYGLALIFGIFDINLSIVRWLQCVLGATGCVALAWVAGRSLRPLTGLIAGMLLALFPRAWFYDAQIEKTGPTVALTAVAIALWWWAEQGRSRRWAAVGFSFGLLCLLRGNFLALAPVLALGSWLRTRSYRAVLWLTLASIVAIAPATLRNLLVSGEFVLVTSQGGQNFFIGNWQGNATGLYVPPPFLRPHPSHEEDDLRRFAERQVGGPLGPTEVGRIYWRWGLEEVARDPAKFVRASLYRLAWLWHPDEVPDNSDERFLARFIPVLAGARWFALVLLAMGLAGAVGLARRSSLARLVLGFALAYSASLVAFFVFGRYRMPLFPALCLGSALWIEDLVLRLRAQSWRGVGLSLGPLLALLVTLQLLPPVPEQDGQNWNTYGSALERAGNRPAARRAYLAAVAADRRNPLASYNVARLLAKDGRLRDAEVEYRRSISLQPELPETHFKLGMLLLDLGEVEMGVRELEIAITLDADFMEARDALVRAAGLARPSLAPPP